MSPVRQRRDTRTPALVGFGCRENTDAPSAYRANGKPVEEPARASKNLLRLLTDRDALREWQTASISWHEWRVSDKRNAIGLTPRMVIPVFALSVFLLVFHWPADGNWRAFGAKFSPATVVNLAHTFDAGATFHSVRPQPQIQSALGKTGSDLKDSDPSPPDSRPSEDIFLVWGLLIAVCVVHKVKPQWLRAFAELVRKLTDLSDQTEPSERVEAAGREREHRDDRPQRTQQGQGPNSAATSRRPTFGRKPI